MFKNLFKGKEGEKQVNSEKAASPIRESHTGAQGFICPKCLINQPSVESLQAHFERCSAESPQYSDKGFLCPMCMKEFYSDDELKIHYDQEHGGTYTSANRDGDVLALRQELDDLRTSLTEEKWYSTELKKEVEKMQENMTPKERIEFDEKDLFRTQLKASEDSRGLLSSEVILLRKQYTEALNVNSSLDQDKEKLQLKAATVASEIVEYKSQLDEIEGQKAGLQEHIDALEAMIKEKEDFIIDLENQLSLRPHTDDVSVLQEERRSIQAVMDKLTLEKESESEQLQKQCSDLQEKVDALTEQLNSKSISDEEREEIKHLQSQLMQAKKEISELNEERDSNQKVMSDLQQEIDSSQSEIINLQQKLDTNCKQLQEQLEKAELSLKEKDASLRDAENKLLDVKDTSEQQILKKDQQYATLKQELDKLTSEYSSTVETKDVALSLEEEKIELEKRLQADIVSLRVERDNLSTDNSEMELKIRIKGQELVNNQHDFEQQKEMLQTNLDEYKRRIEDLVIRLKSLEDELQHEKSKLQEKLEVEALMSTKLGKLETDKTELHGKLTSLQEELTFEKEKLMTQLKASQLQVNKLQTILEQKDEVQKDLQIQVETLSAEIKKPCVQCKNYESQMVRLQLELKEASDDKSCIVEELKSSQDTTSQLFKTLEDVQIELALAQERKDELQKSLDDVFEAKNKLLATVHERDSEVQQLNMSKTSLMEDKEILEGKLVELNHNMTDLCVIKAALEHDLVDSKTQIAQQKQTMYKDIQSLEEGKLILINQKLELGTKIDSLQKKIYELHKESEERQTAANDVQSLLRNENFQLQDQLTKETEDRTQLEKEKNDSSQHYEIQLTALNENLNTFRVDLDMAREHIKSVESQRDKVHCEKLEMEAKLENNNDERRVLLERCISGENECEKLRGNVAEIQRKLEDSQAALLELGRENQTLQMSTTQVSTRKWTDDRDALECEACAKLFSVTVRKHHCRNCGHIYCHECSSRSEIIASSKKPVRVCDSCFIEINQNRTETISLQS